MHAFTTLMESTSQKRPTSVQKGNAGILIPFTILRSGAGGWQVASAGAAKFSQLHYKKITLNVKPTREGISMQKTFTFYQDSGHGWAKIPLALIRELGILDRITEYSYIRKNFVYLEEDCDLSLFDVAFRDHFGHAPKFRARYSARSTIRSYLPFDASCIREGETDTRMMYSYRHGIVKTADTWREMYPDTREFCEAGLWEVELNNNGQWWRKR